MRKIGPLVAILVVGLVVGGIFYLNRPDAATSSVRGSQLRDTDGWYNSIQAAKDASGQDAGSAPIFVVATARNWGGYEKNTFDLPSVKEKLAKYKRVRLPSNDPELAGFAFQGAPALVVLNADGKIITRMVGLRDASVVERTIEQAIQYPLPVDELALKTDPGSQLRAIEVYLEHDKFDSAFELAEEFLAAGEKKSFSKEEAAKAMYYQAYALAEQNEANAAGKAAKAYLKHSPQGEDANGARWVLMVMDLKKKRGSAAKKWLNAILESDSSSPRARQGVLAYSMEYLARTKRKIGQADQLLTQRINKGDKWKTEYLVARSALRLSDERTIWDGIADLEIVAQDTGFNGTTSFSGHGAQERLIQIAASMGDEILLPRATLFFQNLVRNPAHTDAASYRLARLYFLNNDAERAKEESQKVAAANTEYSDDALLLLGSIALELDMDPHAAAEHFGKVISKYPDRETIWPAKYGRARALFFTGDVDACQAAIGEVSNYLKGKRILEESFYVIIPPGVPPRGLSEQLADFDRKITAMKKEEKGEEAFRAFLVAFLAANKEAADAETQLLDFVGKFPASSFADDALIEVVKIKLKNKDMDSAKKYLATIVKSYKGSDQHQDAARLLQQMKLARR